MSDTTMAPVEPPRQGGPLGHSPSIRYERDQRRVQVSAMLASHVPNREMARRLGVAPKTIRRDVEVLNRYWRLLMAQNYDRRVAAEFGKLDALERAFTPKALLGDPAAGFQLRWIYERRARMMGSDAPARTELTVITEDVVDAELRRLSEKLGHGATGNADAAEDRSIDREAASPS